MSVHAEASLTSLDNDTGLSSLLDRSCVFVSCLVSGEFEQQHTPSNENTVTLKWFRQADTSRL